MSELLSGPDNLRLLSHGGGTQTSALALMACHGEIEPFDLVVFADTQWEPKSVYRYLDEVTKPALEKAGMPFKVVSAGNLRDDALQVSKRFASMPLYTLNQTGGKGQLRRQCTNEYKLNSVRTERWKLYLEHKRKRRVSVILGISWEESERVNEKSPAYVQMEYPLIDKRMTRRDCYDWLVSHGYPPPPKSACIGCPFRRDGAWLRMARQNPEEFEDAANFDDTIRENERLRARFRDGVFLHDGRIPLRAHVEALQRQGTLFAEDDEEWMDEGGCGTAGACAV